MIGKESVLTGLLVAVNRYGEDSAIATLAGEKGLTGLLLSGVYKPKSPLKPLLLVGSRVQVYGREREKGPFLAKQCAVLFDSSPLFVREDGNAFLTFLQEVSTALYDYGDNFPGVEVSTLLVALRDGGDVLSLSLLFLGLVYRSLGLEMETHRCVRCKKTSDIVSYSLGEGGFLCADCARRLEVDGKDRMSLYVFKFAFLPIEERTLEKRVPRAEGGKVLLSLAAHLADYFDLRGFRSLSYLLTSCSLDGADAV